MKGLISVVTAILQDGASRGNLKSLLRLVAVLLGLVALFSVLFHVIMLYEGKEHSWITGVYWTLTVMSTLGFGDITFHSDLGRIFSIVVLVTGVIYLLVLLPFTFIEFFYAPWMRAHELRRGGLSPRPHAGEVRASLRRPLLHSGRGPRPRRTGHQIGGG
jgi:hypothetical protein